MLPGKYWIRPDIVLRTQSLIFKNPSLLEKQSKCGSFGAGRRKCTQLRITKSKEKEIQLYSTRQNCSMFMEGINWYYDIQNSWRILYSATRDIVSMIQSFNGKLVNLLVLKYCVVLRHIQTYCDNDFQVFLCSKSLRRFIKRWDQYFSWQILYLQYVVIFSWDDKADAVYCKYNCLF